MVRGDPAVLDGEGLGAGEQRSRVPVGADAQNPDTDGRRHIEVTVQVPAVGCRRVFQGKLRVDSQDVFVRDLQAALARLPDEQREVLILVGLEEMSYKQAAEITGVPLGTVMSRLARGRERLDGLMNGKGAPVLRSAE